MGNTIGPRSPPVSSTTASNAAHVPSKTPASVSSAASRAVSTVEVSSPAAAAFTSPEAGPKGAYYRKVISNSTRDLVAISGTGVLPHPTFDPTRQTPNGPRDVPDVYMGGTSASGAEIDCGLSWDRVHDDSGRPLFTDQLNGCDGGDPAHQFHQVGQNFVDGNGKPVDPALAKSLKPDFAYHPYFRTDFKGQNNWGNRDPSDKKLTYLYPGQQFAMKLSVGQDGKARLDISNSAGTRYAAHFDAPGFANTARQLKRVISIDQTANESKPVQPTKSTLSGGGWNSVALIRGDASSQPLVPGHGKLIGGVDQLAHYDSTFHVSNANAAGGEWVSITPSN